MLYDRKRWEPKIPIVKPVKPRAKPKPWQRVLRQAASYIQKHGWVQGMLISHSTGRVCIMGAIQSVTAIVRERDAAANAFRQHISKEPAIWNDSIALDAEEVIKTLRAAARGRSK